MAAGGKKLPKCILKDNDNIRIAQKIIRLSNAGAEFGNWHDEMMKKIPGLELRYKGFEVTGNPFVDATLEMIEREIHKLRNRIKEQYSAYMERLWIFRILG